MTTAANEICVAPEAVLSADDEHGQIKDLFYLVLTLETVGLRVYKGMRGEHT